jgi:very-short-patch-repair endonuclease
MKQHSNEKFIEKAKAIHGNKYDYSSVVYTGSFGIVDIICPIHGIFQQRAKTHLECKCPCPTCWTINNKKSRTDTHEVFLEKFMPLAVEKHGNKYDYSKISYVNTKTHIDIICHEHGVFKSKPSNHILTKHGGCPSCYLEGMRKDKSEFIEKAKEIHGDKYDYSLVDYKTARIKVDIICPIHGVFKQIPDSHTRSSNPSGCIECSYIIGALKNSNTAEYFLEKAYERHGNKYDYTQMTFVNYSTPIDIVCPEHGIFTLTPKAHIKSHTKCPKCSYSRGEYKIMEILESENIKYKHQHRFKTDVTMKKLSYDFFIEDMNLCIEYDGLQHFEPVKHFGGEQGYIKRVARDEIKNKYCSDNNINIIRVKYDIKDI